MKANEKIEDPAKEWESLKKASRLVASIPKEEIERRDKEWHYLRAKAKC